MDTDTEKLQKRQAEHDVTLAVVGEQIKTLNDSHKEVKNILYDLKKEVRENKVQLSTGRGILIGLSFILGAIGTWLIRAFTNISSP